ncbi:MAG: cell wall metabolism sensor histidine kinase WalK [Cellulosilyticum sp.]|nr:cell wall metabolism sensor histidine kinase WalK [Cellulosilyticum sp.]
MRISIPITRTTVETTNIPIRSSIQTKIILIYLCIIVMIMIVSGTFIVYRTEQEEFESISETMEYIGYNVATMESYNMKKAASNISNNYEIYILDQEGRVKDYSSSDLKIDEKVSSEVVIDAIANQRESTSTYRHFSSLLYKDGYLEHARPTPDGNIIYIRAKTIDVYHKMLSIMSTIAMGLVLAMIITGICGITFASMITSPIKALTINSKKLATGNTISRIPVEAADEIGELTQSFNYMASQLSATMEVITSEKNKLEKIFEHMADGVMAFNQQGILIHVNSVCYEMLGNDKMGPNFEIIFEKLQMKADFDRLLQGEHYEGADEYVIIDDKYLKMQFDVYRNAKGDPDGLVVVIQDFTKQQKLDQMRKEFVANVSHELRTPLTTVKIYTETLIDGAIDDRENAMHFLGVMEKEADRMTALVQDLLELSRIDNKQIQLNFVLIELKDIINEVVEAQHIHIINKGHSISVKYDENLSYFTNGDVFRIRQILHNILSNAIKYTVEEGKITVTMHKASGKIIISVKDTGIGIPKEDLNRIFERFYRVDKARSRKLGGTGLGLSIAKELMALHGGKIEMKSEADKGSEVILTFNEAQYVEEDFE